MLLCSPHNLIKSIIKSNYTETIGHFEANNGTHILANGTKQRIGTEMKLQSFG